MLIYDLPMQYTAVDYYGRALPIPSLGLPIPKPRDLPPASESGPDNEDVPETQAELENLSRLRSGFWLLIWGDPARYVENWLDDHRFVVGDYWLGSDMHLKHYRPGPIHGSEGRLPGGLPVGKDFGPMRLGQVRGGEIQPGSPLLVETMWQVSTTPIKNYSVSAQLLDETGRRVAQADGRPFDGAFDTSNWAPTDSYPDATSLQIPGGLAPGEYHLAISVYDGRLSLGQQTVMALPYLPGSSTGFQGKAVTNAGWTIDRVRLGTGASGALVVVVTGVVNSSPDRAYTWFAHVLDRQGRLLAQDDHPPVSGTMSWRAGDPIQEVFQMPDPGASQVEIGAYDARGTRVQFQVDGTMSDHLLIDPHEHI